jgi:hypothetical protein
MISDTWALLPLQRNALHKLYVFFCSDTSTSDTSAADHLQTSCVV